MEAKKRGRPVSDPEGKMSRMVRVFVTPRQDRLLKKLRKEYGMAEAEHIRRALDNYLHKMIRSGDLLEED